MDCDNICDINQLKLDRPAKYNHWGRIDKRTGLDQRAEVGLLSRNVRFYGSETNECEYAESRCSGEAEDGPCPGNRVPKADIAEPEGGFPDLYCYSDETRHNCESKNFCYVLLANEPEDGKKDFHGANIFLRGGTRNVHLRLVLHPLFKLKKSVFSCKKLCKTKFSHLELFHVGQARLARYPIHFHYDEDFNYRAEKYGEVTPQSRVRQNC